LEVLNWHAREGVVLRSRLGVKLTKTLYHALRKRSAIVHVSLVAACLLRGQPRLAQAHDAIDGQEEQRVAARGGGAVAGAEGGAQGEVEPVPVRMLQ
jgi:hypothetical protein